MKYFLPMLCVVAAGGAGYVFEPKITPNLLSSSGGQNKTLEAIEKDGKIILVPATPTPTPDPTPALPEVKPTPAPEPPPVVKVDPVMPTPAPEPPPVVQVDPVPTPERPVPTPAPEPPAGDPAPPAGGGALGEEDIVKVMQSSIRDGQVKEFKFDQVLAWKAGTEEEVDGTKYQTGQAAYKAETIFGVKTMQAKALIKDGKVAKWVWATSGMEIK